MAKKLYEKLIEDCISEIEEVKELRAKAQAEIEQAQDDGLESHYNEADRLWEKADVILDEIQDIVENAYYEVPFSKPRQQGKKRFWELAGIEQHYNRRDI